MSRWLGNIFGTMLPSNATPAQSGVYDMFKQYYMKQEGGWSQNILLEASGGIVNEYTDGSTVYRSHTFTSSGKFNVSLVGGTGEVEYLVVGGGGACGYNAGGGGGAGGFRTNLVGHPLSGPSYSVSPGEYTVIIGSGGTYGPASAQKLGNISEFYPTPVSYPSPTRIRSDGGGGGGNGGIIQSDGVAGGSGGGGGAYNTGTTRSGGAGNTPPYSPPQGNPGGNAVAPSGFACAGGGGAGQPGNPISTSTGQILGSAGGNGSPIAIESSTAKYYAGGGAGRNDVSPTPGGLGGGGSSGPGVPVSTMNGAYSTGGGGAGEGGSGGSGIVVIRYPILQLSGTAKATGGSIGFYNNKTIHVFTSTGTFAAPPSFNETVEYFIVGSGGGGGNYGGGGGGAGGVRNGTVSLSGPISYTVTIGAGGQGPMTESENGGEGVNGNPSSFGPIGVGGGGGGGSYTPPRAGVAGPAQGGSGGGAGSDGGGSWNGGGTSGASFPGTYPYPASPSTGWGHAGGNQPSYPGSGGGGGAGAAGGGPVAIGGIGIQAPTTFLDTKSGYGDPAPGAPRPGGFYFAAGGNGGTNGPTTRSYGGGGYYMPGGVGVSGLENTGSGGGGGGGPTIKAGNGGSGIVMIAYPT